MNQASGLIPRPVAAAIAIIVIIVWAVSQLASIFVPGYEAPEAIHAALMIVLGSLFALQRGGKAEGAGNGQAENEPAATDRDAPDPTPSRRGGPQAMPAAELIKRLREEQARRDQ